MDGPYDSKVNLFQKLLFNSIIITTTKLILRFQITKMRSDLIRFANSYTKSTAVRHLNCPSLENYYLPYSQSSRVNVKKHIMTIKILQITRISHFVTFCRYWKKISEGLKELTSMQKNFL